jgi:gamma-glutamylputrescine oxidase
MMFSIWERETILARADHLIIGAGITGLNAAIRLKGLDPGARIVVLDRNPWGGGASYRNAGFACLGSPTELLDDIRQHGEELVWELVDMRWKGLQRLLTRVPDRAMDLQWCGGVELFPEADRSRWEEVTAQLPALNGGFRDILGPESQFLEQTPHRGFRGVSGQIAIAREGRLHSGRMMKCLRSLALGLGVEIHTGVTVGGLEPETGGVRVHTREGPSLEAGNVGIATNGFTPDWYPLPDVQPARNQVYLTSPVPGLTWDHCLHVHSGYIYARRVGDRVLIGGARHLDPAVETTSTEGLTPQIGNYLQAFLERHLLPAGSFTIDLAWSGIMGVGETKRPMIAPLGGAVYAAIRLGGMGVAIGTLVGESLAEMMAAQ